MTYDVQAHIDAKRSSPIPKGVHVVRDTLTLTQSYGYKLCGEGGQIRNEHQATATKGHATTLVWDGPAGKPVLEILGNTGLVVQGVNILAGTASQGILLRDAGGSLNIALRDFGVVGGDVGIQCGDDKDEATCANILYENLHFQSQREACVRLMNQQSLVHKFLQTIFALSPLAVDVQHGGDVSIDGGNTYELGTLLKITGGGRNCRGYDVSIRFDGKAKRTTWLEFGDNTKVNTIGPVTFSNCAQNAGQLNSDKPLISVCPGARVVCRECSFDGFDREPSKFAHVYSHRYGQGKEASGELIVENCDGLDGSSPETLANYVTLHGQRAFAEFRHCGTMWGPVNSWSNFPDQLGGGGGQPQFTAEEAAGLRAILGWRDKLGESIVTAQRVRAGELRTLLPAEGE